MLDFEATCDTMAALVFGRGGRPERFVASHRWEAALLFDNMKIGITETAFNKELMTSGTEPETGEGGRK